MEDSETNLSIAEARELLREPNQTEELPSEGRTDSEGASEAQGGVTPAHTPDSHSPANGDVNLDESSDTKQEATAYLEGTVGLGVDIVEIERMASILKRNAAFAEIIFSPDERKYCESKANPATHYALRFAAKEAVVKALGTGFAEGIWVHDIEVARNKRGKPIAILSGRAKEIADEQGVRDLSISLSNTHTEAVACALAITEASVRSSEKRTDPMEELAKKFKETRGMLDEL